MKKITLLLFFIICIIVVNGQTWDWVQTIRPGGNEYCWNIATDNQNNILATGRVKGFSTFGSGTYTVTTNPIGSETDVFTAKYRPNGNLVWVKRDGGIQPDWGRAICTDYQDNVIVTGDYCDTAYFGTNKIIGAGTSLNRNIFLAKYDSLGNCQWVKTAGNAAGHSRGYGATVDSIGNIYIAGHVSGKADFDGDFFGVNGTNLPFIAKFSPNGTCLWAVDIGINYGGECNDIKIDNAGNVLITGTYRGTLYWGATPFPGNSPSWGDVFLIKMNANTGSIMWVKTAVGAFQDQANAVDIDSQDNIYISGTFANDLTFGGTTINSLGWSATAATANLNADAFIAKYNTNGVLKWVKTIGNKADLTMDDIEITNNNKLLVAGFVRGPDFNLAGNALLMDTTSISYLIAFDTLGNVLWNKFNYERGTSAVPNGICTDSYGNCYIGGEFVGDPYISFDSIVVQSEAGVDGYIGKLFPPLDPIAVADYTIICPSQNVNLAVLQDGYPLSYQWDLPGGIPSSSTLANPMVNYAVAGTYTVTLIIGNGHEIDTTSLTIEVTPGACTTVYEYVNNVKVTIAPQPASTTATIHFGNVNLLESTTFQLYNYLGQEIGAPVLIENNLFVLNAEQIPSGVYFFNIVQNNSILKTEKLIISK